MYQMSFPAGELINGGWTLEENGELGEGGRIVIHASKNGQRIFVGLWNYTMISSRYEDCYVVWLKTNAVHHWAQIDFHLLGGGAVRNGMNQGELKVPVTCNWYKHTPRYYLVSDPLYSSKYGYEIYLENQSVVGFEVGYVPNPYSRSQRLNILTYKVDIDHDGEQENIDIRFLDGTGASSGILCIIVDGDVVAYAVSNQMYLTEDGFIINYMNHAMTGIISGGAFYLNHVFDMQDLRNQPEICLAEFTVSKNGRLNMRINRNNKVKINIAVIILYLLIGRLIVHMSGYSFKVSDVGGYYAYSSSIGIPDLMRGRHYMHVIIKNMKQPSFEYSIYTSSRGGFGGFYWEEGSNNLWIIQEGGVTYHLYEKENNTWEEWYCSKRDVTETMVKVYNISDTEVICFDRAMLPKEILKDLLTE